MCTHCPEFCVKLSTYTFSAYTSDEDMFVRYNGKACLAFGQRSDLIAHNKTKYA